jgi:hypothetical protein
MYHAGVKREILIAFQSENLKRRYNLEDAGVDGRPKLKLILKKPVRRVWTDECCLEYGPRADAHKHCNKYGVSLKAI